MQNFSKFAFLGIFAIFAVFTDLSSGQGCSKFCICSLEHTECYFDYANDGSCLGVVPLGETYVLVIHGPVCVENRKKLKESIFANTVKVFKDDICGDIINCR